MRDTNGCRIVLLMIPPLCLLLPVAVLTFALERISSALLLAQTERSWHSGLYEITLNGPTTTGSSTFTNRDITLRFNQVPYIAILGVCIVAYIVSAIGIFGIWELRRIEGTARHQRWWSWSVIVSNLVMIGVSVGVLAYTGSVQSGEKGWQRYEDVGIDGQRFTRETWACQIDKFYPSQNWASAACGTAKAPRYLLIAMAVASLLIIVSLWVLIRGRGGVQWLFGGKGRYGGFENLYELQPTDPGATYVRPQGWHWPPPSALQQSIQPVQQWPQQPIQQWAPHPAVLAQTVPKTEQRTVFR